MLLRSSLLGTTLELHPEHAFLEKAVPFYAKVSDFYLLSGHTSEYLAGLSMRAIISLVYFS